MSNKELIDQMIEDDTITLLTSDGKETKFIQIAGVAHKGNYYAILKPLESIEGTKEDQAFVYLVSTNENGEDQFSIVTDNEIIEAVLSQYNRLFSI